MRKLLYLAAGAVLLSAPAAFAQNDSTAPSDQPPPAAAIPADQAPPPPDQGAPVAGPSDQGPPPPDSAAPADQGAPPQAQGPQAQGPQAQGQYGGSVSSNVRSQGSSRLYVQNGEYQGQGVQIISNAPVPDTKAVRRMFPPLSRAGRRTAPAGN